MSVAADDAQVGPGRGRTHHDLVDAAALVLLLFCIIAAERLAAAGALAANIRAGSVAKAAFEEPQWPQPVWAILLVIGLVAAALVLRRLRTEAENGGASVAALRWLRAAGIASIAFWGLWQLRAVAAWGDTGTSGAALHLAAIAFALVALGASAQAIEEPPDVRAERRRASAPSETRKRASALAVHVLIIAGLVAMIFVVPLTAAQIGDVFRAWGDGPLARVAFGIAAALLLGAVSRASAIRLLLPVAGERWWDGPPRSVLVTVGVLLGSALLVGRLWFAGGLVLVGVVVGLLTERAPASVPPQADRERLRRVANALGVAPLAIVFCGLGGALIDTLLLPSSLTDADTGLLAATAVAAAVLTVLIRLSRFGGEPGPRPQTAEMWAARIQAAVLGGLLTYGATLAGTPGDIFAVVLAIGAFILAVLPVPRRGAPQFWAGGGAFLGLVVAVYAEPVAAPRSFGTLGVALVAMTGLVLGLHVAATVGQDRKPRLERWWLPRRVPLVGLLALWAVAAWAISPGNETVHQARTIDARRAPAALEEEVNRWLDGRVTRTTQRAPMLLVAASGGGAKAAYWTDLVLDCLFGQGTPVKPSDPDARRAEVGECRAAPGRTRGGALDPHDVLRSSLFATSSVSGGSIGVHHYVRRYDAVKPWVDRSAGREVLSPAVAWGALHDLPAFMLGLDLDPRRCRSAWSCRLHADRAVAQEAAVAAFPDGLLPPRGGGVLQARDGGEPVTIFNGALDGANGRVLISPVALSPPRLGDRSCATEPTGEPVAGATDAHDMLNTHATESPEQVYVPQPPFQDVPLVTAALLSARFPVVAPAARLGDARPPRVGCKALPPTLPPVHVRDGGYVENTGVLTLVQLVPSLKRAIRRWQAEHRSRAKVPIVVVSIDDDPAVPEADPELSEQPRETLGISKRAGPGYVTQLARDTLESCQYRNLHYARVSPAPHLGAQAATGWELSRTVREEDLAGALDVERPGAGRTVDDLRAILDGDGELRCPLRSRPEGRPARRVLRGTP
jgi:hypothetical protein